MTIVEKRRARLSKKESEARVIDATISSGVKKSVHEHYLKNKKVYDALARL